MLVITRKPSNPGNLKSSFYIGDDIKITILAIKGGQALIGIKAPKNIQISRAELLSSDFNESNN